MVEQIRKLLKTRLVRFILVGALNTAFSYGLYVLFLSVGLSYALANLLALFIGMFFSFVTQGTFVFGNSDKRLFGRFIAVGGLIYLLNIAFIGQLLWAGLNAYIAGAVTIIPSTAFSYLLQRFYVFRRRAAAG